MDSLVAELDIDMNGRISFKEFAKRIEEERNLATMLNEGGGSVSGSPRSSPVGRSGSFSDAVYEPSSSPAPLENHQKQMQPPSSPHNPLMAENGGGGNSTTVALEDEERPVDEVIAECCERMTNRIILVGGHLSSSNGKRKELRLEDAERLSAFHAKNAERARRLANRVRREVVKLQDEIIDELSGKKVKTKSSTVATAAAPHKGRSTSLPRSQQQFQQQQQRLLQQRQSLQRPNTPPRSRLGTNGHSPIGKITPRTTLRSLLRENSSSNSAATTASSSSSGSSGANTSVDSGGSASSSRSSSRRANSRSRSRSRSQDRSPRGRGNDEANRSRELGSSIARGLPNHYRHGHDSSASPQRRVTTNGFRNVRSFRALNQPTDYNARQQVQEQDQEFYF